MTERVEHKQGRVQRGRGFLWALAVAMLAGFQGGLVADARATVLYVSADALPGGDGASWETSYRFLKDALTAAGPGSGVTEIRVAQGVYKPDRSEAAPTGTGDREATFQLVDGVALLGGYAGPGFADPDERDWELYETILSGDLLGNDGPNFENYEDNSYTVVMAVELGPDTTLEGFIIEAGNSDHPLSGTATPKSYGGGLWHVKSSVTIRTCLFRQNSAMRAGAVLNSTHCDLVLDSCTFVANHAARGGALFNWAHGHATITDCKFESNTAQQRGGAMKILNAVITVTDSDFVGNFSGEHGGAMFGAGTTLTLDRCTFALNEALGPGGAIYIGGSIGAMYPGGCFTIIDCEFTGNNSVAGGAAILTTACNESVVLESTFSSNTALLGGGLIFDAFTPDTHIRIINSMIVENVANFSIGGGLLGGGDVEVVNTVIARNVAGGNGAGAHCTGPVSFINSTIAHNEGGGVYHEPPSLIDPLPPGSHYNVIVWGNTDGQIDGYSGTSVNFSNIQGGWSGAGSNNIDADPLFVQPGMFNFRLSEGSPCIDIGDNSAVPPDITTDLDGNPRIQNRIVDLGPYEGEYEPLPPAAMLQNLPPGGFSVLSPSAGLIFESAAVLFQNLSSTVTEFAMLTQLSEGSYPVGGGFSLLQDVFELETSNADGTFLAAFVLPFTAEDLNGHAPQNLRIARYDEKSGNWNLAVNQNLGGSSLQPAIEINHEFTTWSLAIGAHGVFWNPETQTGFVWANVDRTGFFGAGVNPCPLDLTGDGGVGVPDLLMFLGWWQESNPAADLNGDGEINLFDLLLLLDAWGSCP